MAPKRTVGKPKPGVKPAAKPKAATPQSTVKSEVTEPANEAPLSDKLVAQPPALERETSAERRSKVLEVFRRADTDGDGFGLANVHFI